MNEATKKIDKEIEAYRKRMYVKNPEDIYRESIRNIFMEGTAYYARQLADASEELSKLVLVGGKTLEQCAEHVTGKARSVCGGMGGDLPTEQFHAAIWEYYRMPVKVAQTAIKDAQARQRTEMNTSMERYKAKKANEPKQLTFMDMVAAANK